jgi:hypothetical protein
MTKIDNKSKTVKSQKISKPLTQVTQTELKRAYSLVTQDLFNSLIKAKTNTPVPVGTYG